jgi:hypothetical protein
MTMFANLFGRNKQVTELDGDELDRLFKIEPTTNTLPLGFFHGSKHLASEPSLATMVKGHYARHFDADAAQKLTERYLAQLRTAFLTSVHTRFKGLGQDEDSARRD